MNKPLVAVTGATGFLGLHLIPTLIRGGARVRILARRDPAHEAWNRLEFETVPGRLEDADALRALAQGADAVIHIAGLIKAKNRAEFMGVNQGGTERLAAAARQYASAARFIAVSSLAAREPQLSGYAFSKRAGEDAARAAYADAPERLTIIRPPAIYGPWDRETLFFFKAASSPVTFLPAQGRTALIHVQDAADSIAALALGPQTPGLFPLSDDRPEGYTMINILTEIARALGRTPRLVPLPDALVLGAGYVSGWWGSLRGQAPIFSAGKARELLHPDWSISPAEALPASVHAPKIPMAEGLRATAEWYRAKGWLSAG